MIQGIARGGEYAGAATYVAEHTPPGRRGYNTSYIRATPTIGLVASAAITARLRDALGGVAFADRGWRLAFPHLPRVRGDLVLHPLPPRRVPGRRRARGTGK